MSFELMTLSCIKPIDDSLMLDKVRKVSLLWINMEKVIKVQSPARRAVPSPLPPVWMGLKLESVMGLNVFTACNFLSQQR